MYTFGKYRETGMSGPKREFFSLPSSWNSRGGGAVYPHILAIRVCAAGEGMVFKPFSLV